MTILIYDGENLLVDRVNQLTYEHKHTPLVKDKDSIVFYIESESKINIPDKPICKFWGEEIVAWIIVGLVTKEMIHFISQPSNDLKYIISVTRTFGLGEISDETKVYVVTEAGNFGYIAAGGSHFSGFDMDKPSSVCPHIVGYNSKTIRDYLLLGFERKVTALETLVLAQHRYSLLGSKFDHYHIPTRTLKTELNLSARQRSMILDGLARDVTVIKSTETPIQIHKVTKGETSTD